MKVCFFDKISEEKISRRIVEKREKAGLTNTVWVVLEYRDFKKLRCKK